MPKVNVNKNESIDKALRRFRKRCRKESLIEEIKKRRYYTKPSERRRNRQVKSRKNKRKGAVADHSE
jgi:small subunit ribosomal protein S21